MLAYLVFQKSVRRDELIGLLWGDVVESKARNAFRQTLHRVRAALGDDMVSSEQDLIVLRGKERLWCDAVAFQAAITAGEVEQAVQLYGGKFLEGLDLNEEGFADWQSDQRSRLQAAYEGALARGAESALESGNWQLAVERAQLLTAASPHDGEAAVLEATALLAGGRRAEAITALSVYARRMETELGAKPSDAAAAMMQAILASASNSDRTRTSSTPDEARFRKPAFVGRDRELALLLAAWRRSSSGEGRGCVISGELGIGKSRLVSEFLNRAASIAAPLVLQGQERRAAVSLPYASIAEALRPALNAPGLAGASQHLLAEAARLLPELRDQFDLPEPVALTDDTERIRFYEGIAALIDAVSYEQPVCMVLEDLHNASTSTLELVRYLSRRLRASPVFFLATWEGDGIGAKPLEGFEFVQLGALSPGESESLMADLLRATAVEPAEVARVAGLSAGVPLRLTELAEQASSGPVAAALPMTVRDVLWRRLQQCSPHEQRLFVAAALFSQAVGIRLLAGAAHVSESAALEGVLSLERRGLLVQRDGRLTPASPTAAELALETTGAAGVTLLAGWAADALAADSPHADGELARLYSLAERRSSAYRHSCAAALGAAECGASEEAERFIALAFASASTERERAEIDALRLALGSRTPRLLAGQSAADLASAAEDSTAQPEPVSSTSAETKPSPHPPRGNRMRRTMRPGGWVALAAAVLLAGALAIRSRVTAGAVTRGNALVDTLVLVERLGSREQRYYMATGLLSNEVRPARGLRIPANAPAWMDSLSLPWINPRLSPNGQLIAIERVTAGGVDLYVINTATRQTIPLAVGGGDHIVEEWSPDGDRLLVVVGRTSARGVYDSDLYAYGVSHPGQRVPIDTAPDRSVVAARWSPRGTMVAWVAREGQSRQQEVYVGFPDGSQPRNVSRHPAEDFDISWSADGEQLAFTSERDDNAEIYLVEIATGALRRMTFHAGQDSRPSFSPDGQFLAFESARQGRLETYVMTSWAGAPRRLVVPDRRLEIAEWRGPAPPFVDAVSIRTNLSIAPADSAIAVSDVADQYGNEVAGDALRWSSLDPSIVSVRALSATSPARALLVAERQGTARIVVDLAGWRGDTVLVQVTPTGTAVLRDGFESLDISPSWIPLGSPRPVVVRGVGRGGSGGLAPNGDAQWESGVLSSQFITLRRGLSVQAWVSAPFESYGPIGRELSLALVSPDPRTSLDSIAPQFLKLVSMSWLGDAARLRYSVDREFRTEPVTAVGSSDQHLFRISIEESGRVAFYLDGRLRWRSTVSAIPPGEERRVQLWIGSRGTGSLVAVDDVGISP